MFIDRPRVSLRTVVILAGTLLAGCQTATTESATQPGPTPSPSPLDVPGTMETKMTRLSPSLTPTVIEPTIVIEASSTPEPPRAIVIGSDPSVTTMPVYRGIENSGGAEAFAWVEVGGSVFVVGEVPGYGSWVCIVGVDIHGKPVTGFMDRKLELQGVGEPNTSEIPDIGLADCQ